ncbi:MAG: hypothetical protein HN576_03995 [Bacteriovoracaceae bacterium]|jgi:hypothetical protein|nr:hypothetical protein [Bacteriovoracaceae bacterium]
MKKSSFIFITLNIIFSLFIVNAKTLLTLDEQTPDILIQMNSNQYAKNMILNTVKATVKDLQGYDFFDRTMHLPKFDPYIHDKGIADYITGELGAMVAEMLAVPLKGATTTADVYDFHYKIYRPRLSLDVDHSEKEHLDLNLKVQVTKLEIDVDAVYINNQSPGVEVVRSYELQGEDRVKRSRIIHPELRTILDDVYLKLQPQKDKKLLVVDSSKKTYDSDEKNDSNKAISVFSANIKIRVLPENDGTLRFKFMDFAVNLFGAKTGEEFAEHIQLAIGKKSKIGGLESIEVGDGTNELHSNQLFSSLETRKVEVSRMLAQPIIDQIFNETTQKFIEEKINAIVLNPNIQKDFPLVGLGLNIGVTQLGILNPDVTKYDDQMRVAFKGVVKKLEGHTSFIPSYKTITKEDYLKSEKFIFDEISNDRHSLIISISQELINNALAAYVKGKEETLLEGNAPEYAKIGKKGIFIIFDDENQGKIIMDLYARDKFWMRAITGIVTGRQKFFFPIVMIPEISFVIKDKIPTLVVKIKDVDMSDKTLDNGIYGVPSNLGKGRFKKLVKKEVRASLADLVNKTQLELPLPQLKGLNINDVLKIKSDGYGRLNLMLDLSPKHSKARLFTRKLPHVIAKFLKKEEGEKSK